MEWTVSESGEGGFANVELSGDCDLYSAPAFARAMLMRIAEGAPRFRFDFTGVDYLDSTGVGAIIRLLQEAKKRGCELRFRGLSGSPRRVLKMSNILSLMREDEAGA
jgi:anti-sigma B factor antagonist